LPAGGRKSGEGCLIHRGIEPIRSHDIDILIDELPSTDSLRPTLAPLGRFTPYAVAFRYPAEDADPGPSEEKSAAGFPRSTR
jgi:hypothetical protein